MRGMQTTRVQPLQELAYDYLRKLIDERELKPGVIYSETTMAKKINISRTPFKAALIRLSQDKFVDIIPSKGFMLHHFTHEEIVNMYQMRTAVELFCTCFLLEAAETKDGKKVVEELWKIINRMEMTAIDDIDGFHKLDSVFHRKLIDFSHNDEFNALLDSNIRGQIPLANNSISQHRGRRQSICMEHRDIVSAIESGSITECYEAVKRHMVASVKEFTSQ